MFTYLGKRRNLYIYAQGLSGERRGPLTGLRAVPLVDKQKESV